MPIHAHRYVPHTHGRIHMHTRTSTRRGNAGRLLFGRVGRSSTFAVGACSSVATSEPTSFDVGATPAMGALGAFDAPLPWSQLGGGKTTAPFPPSHGGSPTGHGIFNCSNAPNVRANLARARVGRLATIRRRALRRPAVRTDPDTTSARLDTRRSALALHGTGIVAIGRKNTSRVRFR